MIRPWMVSASSVKAGLGSVVLDLPPEWAPGDLLFIMSYCPSRASALPSVSPSGWVYYPSWMFVKFATIGETAPTFSFSNDPGTPLGGFVSAWRGVSPGTDLTKLKYAAEQGGVHPSPGSQFTGPLNAPTTTQNGCEIVYCFQSESTDSHLVSVSHSLGWSLAERAFSKASAYGTPQGWPAGTYTMGLGMWSAQQVGSGSCGQVRWFVTNDGVHPYYGTSEVSFFSVLALPPAPLAATVTPLTEGTARISGIRNPGATITVT